MRGLAGTVSTVPLIYRTPLADGSVKGGGGSVKPRKGRSRGGIKQSAEGVGVDSSKKKKVRG